MNQAVSDIMNIESRNKLVKNAFEALKRKFEILEITWNAFGIIGKTSNGYHLRFCCKNRTICIYPSLHYQVCPEIDIEVELLDRCQREDIFVSRSYPGPLMSSDTMVFLPKGTTLEQLLIQADLEI